MWKACQPDPGSLVYVSSFYYLYVYSVLRKKAAWLVFIVQCLIICVIIIHCFLFIIIQYTHVYSILPRTTWNVHMVILCVSVTVNAKYWIVIFNSFFRVIIFILFSYVIGMYCIYCYINIAKKKSSFIWFVQFVSLMMIIYINRTWCLLCGTILQCVFLIKYSRYVCT